MARNMLKSMKSRKGGIPTIITIVATTIVAMGLFTYTILNQSTSVKEAGDRALFEQTKMNVMLDNPDYVTGKTVLSYYDRLGDANVTVYQSNGTTVIDKQLVDKQTLFLYIPTFGEDGKVESVEFNKVDMGS
jgi:hypothetical protein